MTKKPLSGAGEGAPASTTRPLAGSSARDVAARALVRVWQQAAFASAALDGEVARARLDPRDAALATELCYGVLRVEPALLAKLQTVSDRFRAPSGLVRAHLLIGSYTLCFLDRVPPFAAVSEAVEAARRVADPRVGGFVNAVLRRLATDIEKRGRPSLGEMVAASCPSWLWDALKRAMPSAEVARFLSEGPAAPPHALCVADPSAREATIARLREAMPSATFEAGSASARAIRVHAAGDLRKLPGFGEDFVAQEEGAQVVALALGAHLGERVLDACAGHGNKTWLLTHEVGPRGTVDAADLHAPKLKQLTATLRGKNEGGRAFAVDWSKGRGEVPDGYDRVLVDAPCSGTGTMRRRPEIALRRTAEDVARLAELQLAIVRRTASVVRTGGRLVFAVCSVLREEAEGVVEAAIAKGGDDGARLVPVPFDAPAVRSLFGDVTAFRLLPHVHGTDGYFAASFEIQR